MTTDGIFLSLTFSSWSASDKKMHLSKKHSPLSLAQKLVDCSFSCDTPYNAFLSEYFFPLKLSHKTKCLP
jgi:hypothetical protein